MSLDNFVRVIVDMGYYPNNKKLGKRLLVSEILWIMSLISNSIVLKDREEIFSVDDGFNSSQIL